MSTDNLDINKILQHIDINSSLDIDPDADDNSNIQMAVKQPQIPTDASLPANADDLNHSSDNNESEIIKPTFTKQTIATPTAELYLEALSEMSDEKNLRGITLGEEQPQIPIYAMHGVKADVNNNNESVDIQNTMFGIIEPSFTAVALETEDKRSAQQTVNHSKALKCGFLRDFFFWVRIFVLILSMFLLLLSASYCLGQQIDVKLDIITECEPKEPEEIWQNSYDAYLKNDRQMTAESQFGHTNKACMTTDRIEINTEQLWYSNKYTPLDTDGWNARSIFFLLNSIFLVCVISFCGIFMLVTDIIAIFKGELQMKANGYYEYMGIGIEDNVHHKRKTNKTPSEKRKLCTCKCIVFWKNLKPQLFEIKQLIDVDKTGWIILQFGNEIFEFVIQSQALLLYNGYNASDPQNKNDVYLANKPQFIIAFAVMLSFNLFGSGIMWLFYAFHSKSCHGLLFNRCIFFVDKFSDFLYTLFPFYMLFLDDYNKETRNIKMLLGQLRVDSTLAFVATFCPLTFLSFQCLNMMQSTRKQMIDNHYRKWKAMIAVILYKDDKDMILKKLQSAGYRMTSTDIHDTQSKKGINWIDKSTTKKGRFMKKSIIVFISLCFIALSCMVLSLSINHINTYEKYCNSVSEDRYIINGELMNNITLSEDEQQLLSQYPELYFYNKCLYKIYPFVRNDENVCQCRVFVVDWSELYSTETQRKAYFNITHGQILLSALDHWYMLEKFHTSKKVESEASQERLTIKASMYKSIHMKAFHWRDAYIESIEDGISAWNELEYLALINTVYLSSLPHDFYLPTLQFLLLENNGLDALSERICDLKQLQVLGINAQLKIETIPHCISQLSKLKALWFDYSVLTAIPLSILKLGNLVQFSVFNGNIDYWSLLDYNMDYISVDINDTNAINEWLDDNLHFHDLETTKYWFTLNPICDEIEYLPSKLQYFMNDTCFNPCATISSNDSFLSGIYSQLCAPRYLGNGRCDSQCLTVHCEWDHGDCAQLCFASELTECSYDKLTNNECDDECDNEYCSQYLYGSSFILPAVRTHDNGQELQADLFHCEANITQTKTNTTCSSSVSIYMDPNVPETNYDNCFAQWIGDGLCDDTCRTDECLNDNGDCDEGNGCEQDSMCDTLYRLWNMLFVPPPGVYKFNHSYSCSEMWVNAVSMFGVDPGNCLETLQYFDYNDDHHMNFREFIPAALTFADPDTFRHQQHNCSECIGMQYYNI